jgi:hypothetical protein
MFPENKKAREKSSLTWLAFPRQNLERAGWVPPYFVKINFPLLVS